METDRVGQKASILVVDDDPECLEFAQEVLAPCYEVRTADSAAGCRASLAERMPDLLILDVMMEDVITGLSMTRELKATLATMDIPVIMLTSVNQSFDYRDQVSPDYFPHDRWFDKPVKPHVLLDAVAECLRNRACRRQCE